MTCIKCGGAGRLTITNGTVECSRCVGTGIARTNFYAGIGSRKTPQPILLEMQTIAMQLAMRGWALRSGKAEGADTAFEQGCKTLGGKSVLRVATEWAPALAHAAHFHPAWNKCDDHAKALHARNSLIMLGDDLDMPVSFVVCWTEGGAVKGGTGQALRIAAHYNIPVFNLAVTPAAALWEWLG